MAGSERLSSEQEFWRWFQEHEDRLLSLDSRSPEEVEEILDHLSERLDAVQQGLVFEIGPEQTCGRRQFVVSADGIPERFPAVRQLVAAAPSFEKWEILAFRPRQEADSRIKRG